MKRRETNAKVYHRAEAKRITGELESLGPEFADDGIVKTILRKRIAQEEELAVEVQPVKAKKKARKK